MSPSNLNHQHFHGNNARGVSPGSLEILRNFMFAAKSSVFTIACLFIVFDLGQSGAHFHAHTQTQTCWHVNVLGRFGTTLCPCNCVRVGKGRCVLHAVWFSWDFLERVASCSGRQMDDEIESAPVWQNVSTKKSHRSDKPREGQGLLQWARTGWSSVLLNVRRWLQVRVTLLYCRIKKQKTYSEG